MSGSDERVEFLQMQWRTDWKSNHPIYMRFTDEARVFLKEQGSEVLLWLWDSNRLIEAFKGKEDYFDYSFLIAPAYKALEKWLLIIGPYLGVPRNVVDKAANDGRLGVFLNDTSIIEYFDKALEELEAEVEQRKDLRNSVLSLNSILKTFRHNPAHCGSTIENPLRAETDFFAMINIIDNITSVLISAGIIPNEGKRLSPDQEKERAEALERRKEIASRGLK